MIELNNKTEHEIDEALIIQIVKKFLRDYDRKNYSISIAIVGSTEIQKINNEYRNKNCVTDVLSFVNDEDGQDFLEGVEKDKYLGELVICYSKIKEQARKYSDNIRDEFIFILVHGLLHLVGHEDRNDVGIEEMKKKGEEFIKTL
jgi:probable rRNA maturation factor